MFHRILPVLLGLVLVTGCGTPAEAGTALDEVIHGTADRGRHPAVVALVLDGTGLCSGTLVSPTEVLTARHCVSRVDERIDCATPGRQILGERDPASILVVAGDDVRTGRPVARGSRFRVLPGTRLCGADVAVIELDRAVPGIPPMTAAARPVARAGSTVAMAGFGRRGDAVNAGVGVRYYRARVDVIGANAAEFETGEGSCNGDSGGPAFDPETGDVVGVVSRGNPHCTGNIGGSVWSHASLAAPLLRARR